MITQKEEETLKGAVGLLINKVDEMGERMENIVNAQEKVDKSLQEFRDAKRQGHPITLMKEEDAKKSIKDNLNTQLITQTVKFDVPVATIGMQSKEAISGLIKATSELVESNKTIKPRKPLLKLRVEGSKRLFKASIIMLVIALLVMEFAVLWADHRIEKMKNQPPFWGDRAYQAALILNKDKPGEYYHRAIALYSMDQTQGKEYVIDLETEADDYKKVRKYVQDLMRERDSRDFRVINWQVRDGEAWIQYRFYDEETVRSIHVWGDKKAEETTSILVTDLESAQKYSKRKIWTVLLEAPTQSK